MGIADAAGSEMADVAVGIDRSFAHEVDENPNGPIDTDARDDKKTNPRGDDEERSHAMRRWWLSAKRMAAAVRLQSVQIRVIRKLEGRMKKAEVY